MVDSIPPTYRPIGAKPPDRKEQAQPVESHGDREPEARGRKPFVERRRNPDRRGGGSKRPVYDMRSRNRGRRKTDRGGHPNIETEA